MRPHILKLSYITTRSPALKISEKNTLTFLLKNLTKNPINKFKNINSCESPRKISKVECMAGCLLRLTQFSHVQPCAVCRGAAAAATSTGPDDATHATSYIELQNNIKMIIKQNKARTAQHMGSTLNSIQLSRLKIIFNASKNT